MKLQGLIGKACDRILPSYRKYHLKHMFGFWLTSAGCAGLFYLIAEYGAKLGQFGFSENVLKGSGFLSCLLLLIVGAFAAIFSVFSLCELVGRYFEKYGEFDYYSKKDCLGMKLSPEEIKILWQIPLEKNQQAHLQACIDKEGYISYDDLLAIQKLEKEMEEAKELSKVEVREKNRNNFYQENKVPDLVEEEIEVEWGEVPGYKKFL